MLLRLTAFSTVGQCWLLHSAFSGTYPKQLYLALLALLFDLTEKLS
jgi:hypothetical protein